MFRDRVVAVRSSRAGWHICNLNQHTTELHTTGCVERVVVILRWPTLGSRQSITWRSKRGLYRTETTGALGGRFCGISTQGSLK